MQKINIIAAIDKNNALGYKNNLLFRDSDDMKHFKRVTENSFVVMGRKTFESIGKPLPNRINVVLTTNESFQPPKGVVVASSVKDVFAKIYEIEQNYCKFYNITPDINIIGGGEVYSQFMNYCDSLIITVFSEEATHADTFFPEINDDDFQLKRTTYLKPSVKIKYYDRRTVR